MVIVVSCNNQNTHNIQHATKRAPDNYRMKNILQKHNINTKKTHSDNSSVLCECFLLNLVEVDIYDTLQCFLLDLVEVDIYDTIQGKVIAKLKNDSIAEDYYCISILQRQGQWIKISAYVLNTDPKLKSGWVKFQEDYFGIYGANYTSTLKVYEKPNMNSKVIHTFPANFPHDPMSILDWEKEWIKIKSDNIIGWVKKEDTCSNPYTTCN